MFYSNKTEQLFILWQDRMFCCWNLFFWHLPADCSRMSGRSGAGPCQTLSINLSIIWGQIQPKDTSRHVSITSPAVQQEKTNVLHPHIHNQPPCFKTERQYLLLAKNYFWLYSFREILRSRTTRTSSRHFHQRCQLLPPHSSSVISNHLFHSLCVF